MYCTHKMCRLAVNIISLKILRFTVIREKLFNSKTTKARVMMRFR